MLTYTLYQQNKFTNESKYFKMNQIYPLIIIAIIGLFVGSITTYYIVRASVKDAMKQSEYYLEIIAKVALENQKD